jgi:hypothetical protein
MPAVATTSLAMQNHIFRPLPLFITSYPVGANRLEISVPTAEVPPGKYTLLVRTIVEARHNRKEFYEASANIEILP